MQSSSAIAVKAFIVHEGSVLLLKRRPNDAHSPGTWDIPGGRLDEGEDPFEGLKREVREEVSVEVNIKAPLDVHHFTRDDGQKITMIIFWCTPTGTTIKISEEHTEFDWMDMRADMDQFPKWLHNPVGQFRAYFRDSVQV